MMKTDFSNPVLSTTEDSMKYAPNDEVSIVELLGILIRRKRLVLAVLFMSLMAAGLLIVFTAPVYESRAVLQIGQIGRVEQIQIGQIELPMELAKRLLAQREETTSGETEKSKTRSFIQTATAENGTNLISITAHGATPDATQKYLMQVVEKVMNEHQAIFDSAREEQQRYVDFLQARVREISQAVVVLNKEIRALGQQSTNANPAATLLGIYLVPERSKLFEQRMRLEQKLKDLRVAMSGLHTKPTVLIVRPSLPDSPVKPRSLRYFMLSIGSGLMLGIAGAFVAEFIGRVRNELKEVARKPVTSHATEK